MWYNIGPDQLAILSALVAVGLAEDRTLDEINIIGNLLIDIGDIMLTIAVLRQIQEEGQQQSPNIQEQIQQLQAQVEELKKRIG